MEDTNETRGPNERDDLLIPLPFEDAIAAALETPPEPEEDHPFGKCGVDEDRRRGYADN